jgi:hypothetical protein
MFTRSFGELDRRSPALVAPCYPQIALIQNCNYGIECRELCRFRDSDLCLRGLRALDLLLLTVPSISRMIRCALSTIRQSRARIDRISFLYLYGRSFLEPAVDAPRTCSYGVCPFAQLLFYERSLYYLLSIWRAWLARTGSKYTTIHQRVCCSVKTPSVVGVSGIRRTSVLRLLREWVLRSLDWRNATQRNACHGLLLPCLGFSFASGLRYRDDRLSTSLRSADPLLSLESLRSVFLRGSGYRLDGRARSYSFAHLN